MNPITAPKLNLLDRVRSYFSPAWGAQATAMRFIEQHPNRVYASRRGALDTRTDTGWAQQPWGPGQTRTLTPQARREMVRRARGIDESNILGSSMLDRAVDNIIGEQMTVQAMTSSRRFNEQVESLWRDEFESQVDVRGLDSLADLQRKWYRAKIRDGDVGLLLLKSGQIQTIESDFIMSPARGGDSVTRAGREIFDGVEVDRAGRPLAFHVAGRGASRFEVSTTPVPARDLIWYFANDRLNVQAVRGVPVLAMLGWLLDQVDGTVEAVVMAHRMAAMFGLVQKRQNPGTLYSGLPQTTTNADGDAQKRLLMEPGSVSFIGADEDIVQVRPEHPHAGFSDLMTFLVRLGGIKLGLPLELALLDFSKTNYSSARASMEQAYRHFRVEQRQFARQVLGRLYQWRVSKWINEGRLPRRDDAWKHRWFGQAWPYLDPEAEAQGALIAIDAGQSTLTDELRKRGMDFDEWLAIRVRERDAMIAAGMPILHSNKTREAGGPAAPPQPENPDDEDNAAA